MKDIINATVRSLESGQNLVMATVIKHKGSTPREAGARMIIRQDGTSLGTIGGGLVEAQSCLKGLSLFASKEACLLQFDMTQQTFDSGSMICGGNMTVLLEYLEADKEIISYYRAVDESYQNRTRSLLVFQIEEEDSGNCLVKKALTADSRILAGDLSCPEPLLQRIRFTLSDSDQPTQLTMENNSYWVEPLSFPKKLILFGAGHVARATAQIALIAGFQVTVVDDRPDLLTTQFFSEPVSLKAAENLDTCCQDLTIDQDSFLVILTRSHTLDKSILAQALRSGFGYLGMIGSRRKRNTIYQALQGEGFSAEELALVHSPIGLDISAHTPEEIAVSIVAQLIEVRARAKSVSSR